MTFDLSSLPNELQPVIKSAIDARNTALALATTSTKRMIRDLLLDISESLGKGAFEQSEELTEKIELAKTIFATKLDEIIATGTLGAAAAGTGIGAATLITYLENKGESAAWVKPQFIQRAVDFAEKYAKDEYRVYAPGTKWKLSERIWNLADNNLEDIQKILQAGEGTDAVKLAKSLRAYINDGRETFAEQYPNMIDRMEGRIAKNTSYEALRLARNELSEAYWDSSIAGYKDNEAIQAVKQLLSNNRPEGFHDICDRIVTEDLYGLGPGCFPVELAPSKPHILCLCCLVPVVRLIESGKNAVRSR